MRIRPPRGRRCTAFAHPPGTSVQTFGSNVWIAHTPHRRYPTDRTRNRRVKAIRPEGPGEYRRPRDRSRDERRRPVDASGPPSQRGPQELTIIFLCYRRLILTLIIT